MLLVAVLLACAGCLQPGRPPVAERSAVLDARSSGTYVVTPGDTLYSVAWRFGLDHKALARVNGIAEPYTIYVGQSIRLAESAPRRPARRSPPQRAESPPDTPSAKTSASRTGRVSGWRPPTDAPVERSYGNGNKGIDFTLGADHPVTAAAAGDVVYAGSGLGGFRHLVIVKHDSEYLSAYSIDRPMAVREGQSVKAGELLAEARRGGRGILHFEIRRNGAPVNPGALIGR